MCRIMCNTKEKEFGMPCVQIASSTQWVKGNTKHNNKWENCNGALQF